MHKKKSKNNANNSRFLIINRLFGEWQFEAEFRYSFEAYLEHILYTRLAFNS